MIYPADWTRLPNERARAAFVLVVCAASVLAAPPARAYRPFDSTDASVAPPGEFELELGPVGYVRPDRRNFLVAPSAIANLGIYDRWELVLQGREFILLDAAPGEARGRLVDTGAFLKAVLREGSLQGYSGPSIGTEFGALMPTVNGDRGIGATLALLISQRWEIGTLHLNVAASKSRAGYLDSFAGLITEGPYTWRVRPALEIFYEREFDVNQSVSALAGLIWRTADHLSLDAAFRVSRVGQMDVLEARAGLTWAFAIWAEHHE